MLHGRFHPYFAVNGERHWQSVMGCTSDDLAGWLDVAASASGREFEHQSKHHFTATPSVQGMWNSYVNTDPAVAVRQFPSDDLSVPEHRGKSATERIREIFQEQQRQAKQEEAEGEGEGEGEGRAQN